MNTVFELGRCTVAKDMVFGWTVKRGNDLYILADLPVHELFAISESSHPAWMDDFHHDVLELAHQKLKNEASLLLRHVELKEQWHCVELSKGLVEKDAVDSAQLERRELDIGHIRLELLQGFMGGSLVFCSTPGNSPYAEISRCNSGFMIKSLSSSRSYTAESLMSAADIIARVWW